MFKLLIADDEQLEREALRFIISKSIDSINHFEEAVNGREAIDKARTTKPDIIILDINMPGINGIEAARKIRESDETACIIFLTAFHQFDYAHEAIKVGVEDYIVKPSSEKRIVEVMEKVTSKLMRKIGEKQKREIIESRLDRVTDYLGSEFIYNLATRTLEEEKFENYLTLLDMDFRKGRGMIMKLNYKSYPILTSQEYQKEILKKRCIRLLKAQLRQHDLFCSCNADLNSVLILVYCDRYNGIMESDEILSNRLQSITDNIRDDLNIDIMLGFGSIFESANRAQISFSEAKKSLSEISDKEDLSSSGGSFPIELEMDLEQAVLAVDKGKLDELFVKLEDMVQSSPASFEDKKNSILDLTVILRHSAALQFPEGECRIDTVELGDSLNVLELLKAFKDVLNELISKVAILYASENIPVIKKACQYIEENYYREISLEDTAAYCNLSTFYFSKIFKEHKKKNFITFLTEIRINEAKRLLNQTDLTMKEISGRIGYRDPNYFTRVFKRVEKCSPRHFRNKKMLKQQ
ncbi:response regulator transcription factor [Spirochaeta isovalerica]|uniref:Two-component system response regulator YesN n=1 Tax=Spirochaeta isovalerica TaxID=150 RepID=A0A841R7K5_9SPIO|nr:response regulator [Spirochaeta isovalerica]MBB6481244.1 two-component system response regulator YesN [Spirochaeta isovalerica]